MHPPGYAPGNSAQTHLAVTKTTRLLYSCNVSLYTIIILIVFFQFETDMVLYSTVL